jgi:hypothetical protein
MDPDMANGGIEARFNADHLLGAFEALDSADGLGFTFQDAEGPWQWADTRGRLAMVMPLVE